VIGIKAIGTYLPEGRVDNLQRLGELSFDEAFLRQKLGIESVSRRGDDEDTAELCERAFAALRVETGLDPAEIECIVVCTQNPHSQGLPHTSAVLHGRIGASERCACWDISLGCTGFVHGLSIVQSFMLAHGMRTALFFTADPYSKIVDINDRNTAMLFGDGAAVTLVSLSSDASLFAPVGFEFHTEGKRCGALANIDGRLHMDGRAVFNFSATVVPKQIRSLLTRLSLTCDDIDLYLLHQGSKYIVDAIRQRLGVDERRIPLAFGGYGNLVSSSIPVILKDHLADLGVRRIVLSGFGVGLAAASCVLERRLPPT
jgi:3-oxoacyl-[acyl-carrier-protein] synthase-3